MAVASVDTAIAVWLKRDSNEVSVLIYALDHDKKFFQKYFTK